MLLLFYLLQDQHGNPPGILHDEVVDTLPPMFKKMIRRLVRWHIDSHDFLRPLCTHNLVPQRVQDTLWIVAQSYWPG